MSCSSQHSPAAQGIDVVGLVVEPSSSRSSKQDTSPAPRHRGRTCWRPTMRRPDERWKGSSRASGWWFLLLPPRHKRTDTKTNEQYHRAQPAGANTWEKSRHQHRRQFPVSTITDRPLPLLLLLLAGTKTGEITVKVRNSVPVVKSASASDSRSSSSSID